MALSALGVSGTLVYKKKLKMEIKERLARRKCICIYIYIWLTDLPIACPPQITVAIYVFRKSWWSGDTILLRAAILLFVPGILKCLEKPWALKNATVMSIMNCSDPRLELTLDEDDTAPKGIHSQEQYVRAAAESVAQFESLDQELFEDELADHPYHLFVDLGHPYSIRLINLRLVAPRLARANVHGLVRSSLSKAFDRLYTKHKASFGGLLRAAVVLLTFADIGLFQRSHRGVYERADVVVTYVLLCCTAALEFVSACLVLGSGLPKPDDQLAQYNLVGYLARNEKHPWLWALARLLGGKLQLDRLWCTAPPAPSLGITRLVYDHVASGWKDYIPKSVHDELAAGGGRKMTSAVEAYRRFNDSRGQRTLEREGCGGRRAIEESLRMPFDESVLLWHLATEFCYFDHVDTGHDATRHSRAVSNYMAYLLLVKPEMLIPGARRGLFRAAHAELRKMLKPPPEDEIAVELEPTEKKAPPPRAENEMVRKVMQKVKSTIGLGSEGLVHKARAVAHELMEFAEEKRREFVQEQKEMGERKKIIVQALREAKQKANEFNTNPMEGFKEKANRFINEVKDKKKTKDEEKFTDLLGDARNKAEELIKVIKDEVKNAGKRTDQKREEEKDKKMLNVNELSESVGKAIKHAEEEERKLRDLMERKLITNEEELLVIRSREEADNKMWAVIQGVWVEMLCFSAGRCRGYLHASSLGSGGEYLSYVWLLLSYMGMETMPERTQRPELPVVGDTGSLVKTPTEDDMNDEPTAQTTTTPAATTTKQQGTSQAGGTSADAAVPAQEQQRMAARTVPVMSMTAVVPVGDDMV